MISSFSQEQNQGRVLVHPSAGNQTPDPPVLDRPEQADRGVVAAQEGPDRGLGTKSWEGTFRWLGKGTITEAWFTDPNVLAVFYKNM